MTRARPILQSVAWVPSPPSRMVAHAWASPTGPGIMEMIRTGAEIKAVGRERFRGSLRDRNALWLSYRNFLRQALSNFEVALTVDNRSASLLYYYAMLNFAKAELLTVNSTAVRGPVHHGLYFDGKTARTVRGDYLVVRNGVFKMLYQHRTGRSIAVGEKLPIVRLIARIPEIGEQLTTAGLGQPAVVGGLHVIAFDNAQAWSVLATEPDPPLGSATVSRRLFNRYFRPVEAPPNWQAVFSLSARATGRMFYESIRTFPFTPGDDVSKEDAAKAAFANTWNIRDLLSLSTMSSFDTWVSPSLFGPRMVPMPPALARYAVTFYASSLVRYRPSMFDREVSPSQAYLFDALARECAIPMLIDTVSALSDQDYTFLGEVGLRL